MARDRPHARGEGQVAAFRSSEQIAYPEQRRELLEDSARGSVRSGHELLLRKRSDVITKITAQQHVLAYAILQSAADAGYELPLVDGAQRRDSREWLGNRRGPRDHIAFRSDARGKVGPPLLFARFQVNQHIVSDGLRLPLNILALAA